MCLYHDRHKFINRLFINKYGEGFAALSAVLTALLPSILMQAVMVQEDEKRTKNPCRVGNSKSDPANLEWIWKICTNIRSIIIYYDLIILY
jgi:hypothetical protein